MREWEQKAKGIWTVIRLLIPNELARIIYRFLAGWQMFVTYDNVPKPLRGYVNNCCKQCGIQQECVTIPMGLENGPILPVLMFKPQSADFATFIKDPDYDVFLNRKDIHNGSTSCAAFQGTAYDLKGQMNMRVAPIGRLSCEARLAYNLCRTWYTNYKDQMAISYHINGDDSPFRKKWFMNLSECNKHYIITAFQSKVPITYGAEMRSIVSKERQSVARTPTILR